jgi:hypothetical protein
LQVCFVAFCDRCIDSQRLLDSLDSFSLRVCARSLPEFGLSPFRLREHLRCFPVRCHRRSVNSCSVFLRLKASPASPHIGRLRPHRFAIPTRLVRVVFSSIMVASNRSAGTCRVAVRVRAVSTGAVTFNSYGASESSRDSPAPHRMRLSSGGH